MRKFMLLSVILCWLCGQNASAQSNGTDLPYPEANMSLPENPSPVETAYNEYASTIEWRQSGNGDLRARPDGIDGTEHAQKIPLGNASWLMAAMAVLTYAAYRLLRRKRETGKLFSADSGKNNRSRIFKFACLLIVTLPFVHSAQAQVAATSKNYFLTPGIRYDLDIMEHDNLGACQNTPEFVTLEILTPMPSSLQQMQLVSNKLRIRPMASFYGQVVLTYKITCGGNSATADLYFNVGEKPDFISNAECTIEPPSFTWSMALKNVSERRVWALACPMSGDMDGDGIAEILAPEGAHYASGSDSMIIFNHDLTVKNVIPFKDALGGMALTQGNFGHPYSIGDVDQDGTPELLVALANKKLHCYAPDGTLKWTSNDGAGNEVIYGRNIAPVPTAADLDGDGQIEILCDSCIFDGASGLLLAGLPAGKMPSTNRKYGRANGQANALHIGSSGIVGPVIADINGDGKQDLICGNTTYDVTLDHSDPSACSVSVIACVDQNDGTVAVADIDGDGKLDVIVTSNNNNTLYVWQGDSPNLIGTVHAPNSSRMSRAFIGDINGDGVPEICHTSVSRMHCWRYDGTDIVDLWASNPNAITSDASGATTMCMFDFNLDGTQELVYRDQSYLRILDKDGNNRLTFECRSATHTEYPIVVDADGDGHAEIYVSGYSTAHPAGAASSVFIMKFDAGVVNNWAPARKVWPQHGYNPVHINDDLSFPAQPLPQTTAIVSPTGAVSRPFNSFLQQTGPTNLEGEELCLAPDLSFEVGKSQAITYNQGTDVATITASLTNEGSIDYVGDIRLSLFVTDKATGDYSLVGTQTYTAQTLAIAQYRNYTVEIPNYLSSVIPNLPAQYAWSLTINMENNVPDEPVPPANVSGAALVQECNYINNIGKNMSFISGRLILCEGESGILNIEPAGVYDCRWFKVSGKTPHNGADVHNFGDSKLVSKPTSNWRDAYIVDVHMLTAPYTKLSSDTVYVYLPSDTLVWSGAYNRDWHDIRNWNKPGDDDRAQQETYIPRGCTNVLIPDGMPRYPDLSAGGTSYTIYSNAACNNIHFAHGGEVFASDKLTYAKAYISVEMLGNRWYCFSPPLRDFYSGDIYVNDPNPFYDYNLDPSQQGMFIYTHLFSQSEPQLGSYVEGGWGRTFNTPNYTFASGQGLGVWSDDLEPDRAIHNAIAFDFPKNDAGYFIYKADGSLESGPHATSRTYSHRFIFEDIIDASNNVKLFTEASSAGKSILVGNPFMAHLDFNAFYDYAANNSLIENYYRVINADGSYSTYRRDGVTTGLPALSNLIAPMQSVLLTPKAVFPSRTLVANSSMTQPGTGKLRSAPENQITTPKHLRVSVGDAKIRSYAALVYDEALGTTTAYDASADVYKVLKYGTKDIPNIYFITSDNRYMDIKTVSSLDNLTVKIGVCGTQTGALSMGFERIWEFYDDHDVYLIDKELNKVVDVRISPRYNFVKSSADTFLNDRFELKILKKGTGIEEAKTPALKTVVSKSFYDLSGRPVPEHTAKGFLIQKSVYEDGSMGFGKVYIR